jgi:hypothetical protein
LPQSPPPLVGTICENPAKILRFSLFESWHKRCSGGHANEGWISNRAKGLHSLFVELETESSSLIANQSAAPGLHVQKEIR